MGRRRRGVKEKRRRGEEERRGPLSSAPFLLFPSAPIGVGGNVRPSNVPTLDECDVYSNRPPADALRTPLGASEVGHAASVADGLYKHLTAATSSTILKVASQQISSTTLNVVSQQMEGL